MNKEIYTDHSIISWVLEHCKILRLGLTNQGHSYVVPVNFGYEENSQGKYVIYIHGTVNGAKGHALDQGDVIGFETDDGFEGLTFAVPTMYSPSYRSVMGTGKVVRVRDDQEKVYAFKNLIHHYLRDIPGTLSTDQISKVPVWKIEVDQITAKVHNPSAEWQKIMGITASIPKGYHYGKNGELISVDGDAQKEKTIPETDANSGASEKSE
ncbi:MAG: pyridoxamine 5'-phosphate oxidase family protein [Lactobacillus sp.]